MSVAIEQSLKPLLSVADLDAVINSLERAATKRRVAAATTAVATPIVAPIVYERDIVIADIFAEAQQALATPAAMAAHGMLNKDPNVVQQTKLNDDVASLMGDRALVTEAHVADGGGNGATSLHIIDAPTTLRSFSIGIMTEREVRQSSVIEVTSNDRILIIDGVAEPNPVGLISDRMGPTTYNQPCEVCGGMLDTEHYLAPKASRYMCPGHLGHVELPGALFHPQFMPTVLFVLRSFCWLCGWLPGRTSNIEVAIERVLARDVNGNALPLSERLRIMHHEFHKRHTCVNCLSDPETRAAQRCTACRNAAQQCHACASAQQFRPLVTKIDKGNRPEEVFGGFPYMVEYRLDKVPSGGRQRGRGSEASAIRDTTASAFENFLDRNNMRFANLELTPERARRIVEGIDWRVAALLMPRLPAERTDLPPAALAALTPFERVFGAYSDAQCDERRRSFIMWFCAMVPRVLPVAPNPVRGTRYEREMQDAIWNELTVHYGELLDAKKVLVDIAAHVVPLLTLAEREHGRHVLRFRGERHWVDKLGVKHTAPRQEWFDHAACDALGIAEKYGLMQYQWALIVHPGKCTHWLPRNNSVKVPASASAGASRTKNRGRGLASDGNGKDGRWRENLMGKRVEFASRSVITPDPNLAMDELGVPPSVGARSSIPVRLCAFNLESELRDAEMRRDDGAIYKGLVGGHVNAELMLFNADRTECVDYLSLTSPVFESPLAVIGSWIERPLRNGDVVLFNRQPSLHAPSFMALRARILPYSSFRINLAVTTPFNADFDGDEMNMHVPQSDEARIEAQMLLAVNENVITTKTGAPCMNLVQNHRLTAYLMTYDHQFIDRVEAMHLLYTLQHRAERNGETVPTCCLQLPVPAIVYPEERWTARQLINCTLPDDFTLRVGELDATLLNCTPLAVCNARPPALIWRGELMYGVLNGSQLTRVISALGGSALLPGRNDVDVQGSAPRACINAVAHFINGMTALTEAYMTEHGFSIGIHDVVSDVDQRVIVRQAGEPSCSEYVGAAPDVFLTELASKRQRIGVLEQQCGSMPLDDALRKAHARRVLRRRHRATLQRERTRASGAAVATANSARDANLTCILARVARKRTRKIAAIDVLRSMLNVRPGVGSLRIQNMARETAFWSSLRLVEVERNVDLMFERVVRARRAVRQKSEAEVDIILGEAFNDAELVALAQLRTEHDERVTRQCADARVAVDEHEQESAVQIKRKLADECLARVSACQLALVADLKADAAALESSVARQLLEAHESEASLHEELARDGAMQLSIKRLVDACEPNVQRIITEHRAEAREMSRAGVGESSYAATIDALEAKILKEVTDVRTAVQSIVFATLPKSNSFRMMVDAGSKGTITNASDVMGMIGQQEIDGRRLCDTFLTSVDSADNDSNYGGSSARALLQPDGYRMLPHEKRGYPGAVCGGFIKSSLVKGATPKEFWSYATSARKNIGDTAIGTAPTGYMSRCITKVVEDKCTDARGAVRAADNTIVQMRAGGTGFNPRFLQTRVCPPLSMSEAQLASAVFIDDETDVAAYAPGDVQRRARADEHLSVTAQFMAAGTCDGTRDASRVTLLRRERAMLREAIEYVRGMTDTDTQGTLCTVGDIEALIAQIICRDSGGACASMAHSVNLPYKRCAAPVWSPTMADADAYVTWRARVDAARLAEYGDSTEAHTELGLLDECDAILLVGEWIDSLGAACDDVTRCELRLRLCAKQVVRRHQMSRAVLLSFMHCYAGWLRRAVCVAGDPVAVIAAQSFSSIGMQMTLNTFHSTGATNVCVVEGMPRALEVLDARVTKRMETPVTTIFAESRTMATRGAARYMKAAIKKLDASGGAVRVHLLEHAWTLMGRKALSHTLAACSARQLATHYDSPPPLSAAPAANKKKRARRGGARKQPSPQEIAARERAIADHEYGVARAHASYRRKLSVPLIDALAAFDVNVVTEFATTLDSMAYAWRTIDNAAEFAQRISTRVVLDGDTTTLLRSAAHGCVLMARVHDAFSQRIAAIADDDATRRQCVALLMCVVWEQLLPYVGMDRSFVVLPLYDRSGRWSAMLVALLHRTKTEACALYDIVRRRRTDLHVQFDDAAIRALAADGGAIAGVIAPYVTLQQCIAVVAADSDLNSDAAEQRVRIDGDRLLFGPLHSLMQSTVMRDVVLSVELRYAPLERTDDDELRLTIPLDCGASEREIMDQFYATAVAFGEGCQSSECARNGDAPADRVENRSCFSRAQPSVCCMSSFVLALRLDREWFTRHNYSVAHLCSLVDRALGTAHHTVVAGDVNSGDGYIPLHIRLHTCQLDVLRARKIDGIVSTSAGNMMALLDASMLTADERALDEYALAVRQKYEFGERERRTEFTLDHSWFVDELRRQRRDNTALPAITDETLDAQYWQLLTQFVIHELERSLHVAMGVSLRGGIETRAASVEHRQCVRYTAERGAERTKERVLAVDSRDYASLMRVRLVDRRRTFTNAVRDVHDTLGLIAARDLIVDELNRIIESGHSFVHRTHLMVLADIFMYKGDYLPFTVHGLQKLGAEPIQIMSFEESSNMASNAAVNQLVVPEMRSPSSCIALGIAVRRLGTEACTLVLDRAAIERAAKEGVLFVPPELRVRDIFATEIGSRVAANATVQPFAMLSPSDANGVEFAAAAAARQSDWQHNHARSEYAGIVDACGIVDEHATNMRWGDGGGDDDDDDDSGPAGAMSPVDEDDYLDSSDIDLDTATESDVEEYDPTRPAIIEAVEAYSPTRPAYSPTEEYDPDAPQMAAQTHEFFSMRGAMIDSSALLDDLPIGY